jgi:hypothetical protein
LAALNPINSSANAAFLAAQYRSQLAQQQYLLAQQQRFIQTLHQRQGTLEPRLASPPSAEERGATNDRRERLRRENAEKAFERAETAEMKGRVSAAQKNYRKVIRILGNTDALSRRATNALELLAQGSDSQSRDTLLTARTR